MLEAINDGLRRFSDFKGRSNKLQYRAFFFFYMAVNLFVAATNQNSRFLVNFIWGLSLIPMIAVQVRRSHDIGKSGWWILVPLYPLYLFFANSVPENPEDQSEVQ